LTLIASLCVFPAAPVDFSGVWIRDVSKRDAVAMTMGGEIKPLAADWIVKQADNELQFERRWDHNASTAVTHKLVPAGL